MQFKQTKNIVFKFFIDIFISLVSFIIVFFLENHSHSINILSLWIIVISIYLVYKVRVNSNLLIIFGIIAYINISIVFGDLLQLGEVLPSFTLEWQSSVRSSIYLIKGAKSILLFMSVLNLIINSNFISKSTDHVNWLPEKKKNNKIFYIGLIIMIIFWVFGYSSPMGVSYESNTRTIYEYSLLIYIIVWNYSGNSKYKQKLLLLYGLMYIVQALIRGDRSSAFPMVTLLIVTNNITINLKRIAALAVLGISTSNIISFYRDGFSLVAFKESYFNDFGLSAFLSDTVSQSYYTAISIMNVGDLLENTKAYFLDFIGAIFLGGDFKNADIMTLSNTIIRNRGGGMYFSWFYFWFGIVGVILGSVILGVIIRSFFNKSNFIPNIYQIAIVTMTFRWYLYTPFVLYRSILFVFTLLYFMSMFFDKITKYSRHNLTRNK